MVSHPLSIATPSKPIQRFGRRLLARITLLVALTVVGVSGTAVAATPAQACCVPPEHAIIVCQSASFYSDYIHGYGPVGYKRTLYYGNKVGHTRGAHPVYNGWAATFDYGPNDWGYVRYECLGGWGSW